MAADEPRSTWSARDPTELCGRVIGGRFRLRELLARGGMAWIYLAEQEPLGRTVVVKILTPRGHEGSARSELFRSAFFREAEAAGGLKHPNTVPLFDFGLTEDGALYIAMEHIEGRTLRELLDAEAPLDPMRAVYLAYQVARAAGAAHAHGIVHCDLKPANVMVFDGDEGEEVRVLDFGVARLLTAPDASGPRESSLVGTPRYMAPEQLTDMTVDPRTDHYGVGALLYEMLCGRPPFRGKTAMATMLAALRQPLPPLDSPYGIPPALEAVVRRCLEKDPDQRFATTDELKAALRDVSLGSITPTVLPAPVRVEAPRAEPPAPPVRARAGLAAAALLLVLLLVLLLGAGVLAVL